MIATARQSGTKPGLSNPAKLMYAAAGFTKSDVASFYDRIAPVLLPHLRGRALTLKRYPNGSSGPHFYEKNCPSHRPEWVETLTVPGKSGSIGYCTISDRRGLLWLANLASLELH